MPTPVSRLDMTALLQQEGVVAKVSIETPGDPAELDARRKIEDAKAAQELWRDRIVLVFMLGGLVVILISCLLMLALPGVLPEYRKWAIEMIEKVIVGALGYAVGKSQSKVG